jgi:phenylpyruvate tautomerase PptA (4-oxalocrotonate tautomerase family)
MLASGDRSFIWTEARTLPHFNVQMFDEVLDGEVEPKIIRSLTDAVVAVYGEQARPLVVVELFGVPRRRWGMGGVPAAGNAPIVTLNMREPALRRPEIEDPPAKLIGSITDAMVEVFGERIRKYVHVLIVGIPPGRSGVGGEVVGGATVTPSG